MDLLELSKKTVMLGLSKLSMLDKKNAKEYKFSTIVPREIKAEADLIIEKLLIDELSELFFVTEPSGLVNLKSEKKDLGNVHFVGNTMIDSLVQF